MSSRTHHDLLGILDEVSGGVHAGFRPAHAKGLMLHRYVSVRRRGGGVDAGPTR